MTATTNARARDVAGSGIKLGITLYSLTSE